MKIYTNEMIKTKLEKQKKMRRIFKFILYPLIVLVVICAIIILYQKIIQKEENINLFGYRPYIVLSGSMEPGIHVGDIVVAKTTNEEKVENSDIITFVDKDGNTITHRVVDIVEKDGKKYYQTKGDNNDSNDEGLIAIEDVKGEYAFKISRIGGIFIRFMTPTGLILLLLIISIAYMNSSKRNDRRIARHLIRERYKKQMQEK